MATGGDPCLALCEQVSAEAHALVVWLDEQVGELVTSDCEVADQRAIDDGYPRLEVGLGPEPISEFLPGAFWIGGLKFAGKQL